MLIFMDNANNSCCCGETEHFSGCLICGAPVTYSIESSVKTCSICHKEQLTNAVCENGHFVCDACHSYGTYIPVSTALRSSTEKDPLLLLEEIMDLPSVHMHGPEHHAIVPSVLLTALRNNGERMNYDTALSEICKRAKQVPGGTCGYWGVCGAAAGAGIFMSVMTGSGPLHKDAWPFPQKLVSVILSKLADGGEQAKVRLCKLVNRDTNVLLLDEPTNHLDVDAKEALKSALKEYRGSILLICHEPEFYQDVVNEVWDMSKWTTKVF